MKRVLFVCGRNRLRSPTAERMFCERRDLEVDSAGTSPDAENPLTRELVDWAELIFVMEKAQLRKVQTRFGAALKSKRLVCLGIPDKLAYMEPALVALLRAKLAPYLS